MCAGVFLLLLHPREREGKEYIKSSAELVFILVVQAFYWEKKRKKEDFQVWTQSTWFDLVYTTWAQILIPSQNPESHTYPASLGSLSDAWVVVRRELSYFHHAPLYKKTKEYVLNQILLFNMIGPGPPVVPLCCSHTQFPSSSLPRK